MFVLLYLVCCAGTECVVPFRSTLCYAELCSAALRCVVYCAFLYCVVYMHVYVRTVAMNQKGLATIKTGAIRELWAPI